MLGKLRVESDSFAEQISEGNANQVYFHFVNSQQTDETKRNFIEPNSWLSTMEKQTNARKRERDQVRER